MRRLWLWVWLAVLVGQLSSLWVVKRFVPPFEPALLPGASGLLDLAQETLAVWEPAADELEQPSIASSGDPLMAREEWLLRIRDAELAARPGGMDVRVSEDLHAWLRSSTGGLAHVSDPERQIAYLSQLGSWLTHWTTGMAGPVTKRLSLQPDSHSDYPAIQFELEGKAGPMAELLHRHSSENLHWQVRELDLIRQSKGEDWWLRGTCVFRNRVVE